MRYSLSRLLCIILTSIIFTSVATATVIVEVNAPPPKEVIVVPKGQTKCVLIPAGIYDGVYVNAHKVCTYNSPKKEVWVSAHWQCANFRPLRRICLAWVWVPGHWSTKTVVVVQP